MYQSLTWGRLGKKHIKTLNNLYDIDLIYTQ